MFRTPWIQSASCFVTFWLTAEAAQLRFNSRVPDANDFEDDAYSYQPNDGPSFEQGYRDDDQYDDPPSSIKAHLPMGFQYSPYRARAPSAPPPIPLYLCDDAQNNGENVSVNFSVQQNEFDDENDDRHSDNGDDQQSLLVAIVGLGNPQRCEIVEESVGFLLRQNITFECLIYIYKTEEALPLESQKFAPCELVRLPGTMWEEHIAAIPVDKIRNHSKTMIWIDNAVPLGDVSLAGAVSIMDKYELGVASLSFSEGNTIPHNWQIMNQVAGSKVGRLTNFWEPNIALLTEDALLCWRSIMNVKRNRFAWGVDLMFSTLCPRVRIGILDSMTFVKLYQRSRGERSDYSERTAHEQEMQYFADLGVEGNVAYEAESRMQQCLLE